MKLQFDANQEYQLEAIKATVDLFAGQPVGITPAYVLQGQAIRGQAVFMAEKRRFKER